MSRAGKSGDAFRQEQKMLEKGFSHRELHEHMKTGVVLCKLVNKLLTSSGQAPVKFKSGTNVSSFAALENIGKFTKACQIFGVPESCLFESVDLAEGRKAPFLNVINCLNTLGFTANSKGFSPAYVAPEAPKADF